MNWIYSCPLCSQEHKIDWNDRFKVQICTNTLGEYHPPLPENDIHAYVDTHEWPVDIEKAVIKRKGTQCTALKCGRKYETLDHRIPFTDSSNMGKTSVNNLFPMCKAHNQSKNDTPYEDWELERMFGQKS